MKTLKNKLLTLAFATGFLLSPLIVSADAYWSRTAEVRDGVPLPVAVELALKFSTVSAENGIEVLVTLPLSGNPNRIRWSTSAEDIAAVQANFARMQQMPAFQEIWVKGQEIFENPTDDWWQTP